MKLAKTFFLISFAFTLNSCIKEPEACLSADKTTVGINEAVTISSCSKEAERYRWTWTDTIANIVSGGDNCSSSVVLKYSKPGTYSVNLAVFSYRGKADCNSVGTNKSAETSISITVK